MKWNWNKLDGTKNTPDFDRQVLLLEKKVEGEKEKCYAMVGHLKSIDANGCQWAFGTQRNIFDDFFSGMAFPSTEEKSNFIPTHWCDIFLPED